MKPTPAEVVSGVVHDLRSGLGVIRLAVTTLEGADTPPDLAAKLLGQAGEESLRLSLHLGALPPLVACLTDRSPLERVDLAAALRRAAAAARRSGTRASVRAPGRLFVRARRASLDAALSALLQLAADSGGEVVVSARRREGRIEVVLSRGLRGPLATRLVQSIGATSGSPEVMEMREART